MVKIYIYTTILTNSVCKGNTFFRKHKRLHPKKNTKYVAEHIFPHLYTTLLVIGYGLRTLNHLLTSAHVFSPCFFSCHLRRDNGGITEE